MSENIILVGTWSLVSWRIVKESGELIAEPLGPNPQGMLIYTEDGSMSVHVMRSNRAQCKSQHPFEASPEEKILTFDTYLGYCGTYEQQKERVIHHVTTSFFPNAVGTDFERVMKLDGNLLTLTGPLTLNNGERLIQITWRRL